MKHLSEVQNTMTEFAVSTGLSDPGTPPRRYLWTDAFAVCNYLGLYLETGDEGWRRLALGLVEQVHRVLGRYRDDDERKGWISGLPEEEGKRHPTAGGLRIGKQLKERGRSDPYDERLEWERDGQYFHYLTKWMHALNRVSRVTGHPLFNTQARELAKYVHAAFVKEQPDGSKRMFWKMSTDLSRPLVPFMGLHDPLDGYITYTQLQTTALEFDKELGFNLASEITDMETLCRGKDWTTEDPLGIGGLLWDSCKIAQLLVKGWSANKGLLGDLLEAASRGLSLFRAGPLLEQPPHSRLPFRELGISIGLHAVHKMEALMGDSPDAFPGDPPVRSHMDRIAHYTELAETIENLWLNPRSREAETWKEHLEINRVMLATSLAPEGFLEL